MMVVRVLWEHVDWVQFPAARPSEFFSMMHPLPRRYQSLISAFAKTIKLPEKKSPLPIAVGPFGPCCVGKSTAMKELAKKLPLVRIDHDALRLFMRGRGYNQDNKMNEILYKYRLILHLAKSFLKSGYSVILDRNFAIPHSETGQANPKLNIQKQIKGWERDLGTKFFLIEVKAPKKFVLNKIKTMKVIPGKEGGLLATREALLGCYFGALKYNYKVLSHGAIGAINTSKPISKQLAKLTPFLKSEVGLIK